MDAVKNASTGTQAAVAAIVTQIGSLVVGYGLMNSAAEGKWVAITMAVVNVGGLVAHAWHRQINTKPYR